MTFFLERVSTIGNVVRTTRCVLGAFAERWSFVDDRVEFCGDSIVAVTVRATYTGVMCASQPRHDKRRGS